MTRWVEVRRQAPSLCVPAQENQFIVSVDNDNRGQSSSCLCGCHEKINKLEEFGWEPFRNPQRIHSQMKINKIICPFFCCKALLWLTMCVEWKKNIAHASNTHIKWTTKISQNVKNTTWINWFGYIPSNVPSPVCCICIRMRHSCCLVWKYSPKLIWIRDLMLSICNGNGNWRGARETSIADRKKNVFIFCGIWSHIQMRREQKKLPLSQQQLGIRWRTWCHRRLHGKGSSQTKKCT